MSRERMELWTEPSCYFGYNPTRDYLLLARHRESDTVAESNWEVAIKQLRELCEKLPEFDQPEERDEYDRIDSRSGGWFYIWRASHSLVGWVEYLMIRGDAPQALIDLGHKIVDKLDAYPILDDDHHSELEFNQIHDWWDGLSISDRIFYLDKAGDSVLAARHRDRIPENTFNYIRDTWT